MTFGKKPADNPQTRQNIRAKHKIDTQKALQQKIRNEHAARKAKGKGK